MSIDPMRARLVRLRAELERERAHVRDLGEAVRTARRPVEGEPDEADLALLAVDLHRWYTAVEALIERIERAFEVTPGGPEWHTELLEGAVLELPGARPPILPEAALPQLRELLRFRHFFRHAYAVRFDAGKLLKLADDVEAVHDDIEQAFADFGRFLDELVGALEE